MEAEQAEQVEQSEAPAVEPEQRKEGVIAARLRKFTPAFMASLAAHLLLVFIISLFPAPTRNTERQVTVVTEIVNVEEEKPPEKIEKPEVQVTDVQVKSETAKTDTTSEVMEVEEAAEVGFQDAPETAVEAVGETATPSNSMPAMIGFAGGSSGGGGGLPHGYGGRSTSGKGKGRARFGGGGTETTVNRALQWLAYHQEADGSWNVLKYEGMDKAVDKRVEHSIATGLALLAFLGDGHSETVGAFKKNVREGVRYINRKMDENKGEGKLNYGNNYGAAIMLMALSEACIFGSSAKTQENANRIAEWFVSSHKGTNAGWRYGGCDQSDFSVSGWVALGLKSGKPADLPALLTKDAEEALSVYKKWVDTVMTDSSGGAKYVTTENFGKRDSMGYVGIFAKHFLGFGRADPFCVAAAAKYGSLNAVEHLFKLPDSYCIYYGTLAAFQQQGDMWKTWNPIMKRTLLGLQCPGDPKEKGGSWDPVKDRTSQQGGRIFTTAMFALCLEVYYRYDQMSSSSN